MIKFVSHIDIDFKKWDNCISKSSANSTYAQSWYLDIVCGKSWNAIILDDYSAVMPLFCKLKWGFLTIRQPYLCQQLGVFSNSQYNLDDFLKAIPNRFKFLSFNLNSANADHIFCFKTNCNHELELNKSDYFKHYSSSIKKNVVRARNRKVCISDKPESVNSYMSSLLGSSSSYMSPQLRVIQQQLMNVSVGLNKGRIISAELNGKICASLFLLICNNRVTLISTYSTSLGKSNSAYFLLIDHVFHSKEFQGFTFDFEGSNLQGVAKVNLGFGAVETHYRSLRTFRIPFVNRLLKC